MSGQSDSLWSLSGESSRSESHVTTVSQVSWLCFGNWNLSAIGRASFELELLMSKPDRNIFATCIFLSHGVTGLQILHSDGLIITLHRKLLLLTWNLITFYGLGKAVERQVWCHLFIWEKIFLCTGWHCPILAYCLRSYCRKQGCCSTSKEVEQVLPYNNKAWQGHKLHCSHLLLSLMVAEPRVVRPLGPDSSMG